MQPFARNIHKQPTTSQQLFEYDACSSIAPIAGKKVGIAFDGGSITSDAGFLLLRETEAQSNIISKLTPCLSDPRRIPSVKHSLGDLMTQRVYQIATGYEDGIDSNALSKDPALKMALARLPESGTDLASQPTISRLENMVTRTELYRMGQVFVDHFISSYTEQPSVIILDCDDTASVTYGHQQMALFSGHYQEKCYQPLHIYEGLSGKLISTILRPGKRPSGKEILAYIKRLVPRIRSQWPDTIMVYRGDSHYGVPEVFTYLSQQQNCYSITGLSRNDVLVEKIKPFLKEAAHQAVGYKRYYSFMYQAASWSKPRRVVAKIEITQKEGLNIRFISTDMLAANTTKLYETIYCARGNDELYIKDHKTYTKSDRTSCHSFTANQFRLFLHSAAYVLLHAFRANMLKGTELATATFATIRMKLLKIGARVIEQKRKIKVQLPTAYPYKTILTKCLALFESLRMST